MLKSKSLVASLATAALVTGVGLSYAQTNTTPAPGTTQAPSTTATPPSGTMNQGTPQSTTTTPGTMNQGTTSPVPSGTMSQGTTPGSMTQPAGSAPMAADRSAMSGERLPRADRN